MDPAEAFKHLPEKLQGHDTMVPLAEVKKAKLIALYFSSLWCPPCKMFKPKLEELYRKSNEKEKVLEIIFVSGDHAEDEFKEYFSSMPWVAIPYDSEAIEELGEGLEIKGIPALLVFSNEGKLIDRDARKTFTAQGAQAVANWLSQA